MMETNRKPAESEQDRSTMPPMVVGIGASAGGIKALGQFFSCVSSDAPIVYVVILHLSPDHDSKLAEVLQLSTPLPVTQVRARVRVEPRHVYVIPPSQTLHIADGELTLAPMTRFEERKAPVDIFFRALAEAYGPDAAAIVLSGTGPDGSAGLKRVKEHGGLTIAQDPGEAEYADMPANSIATGLVDYVLPVAEIPARVIAYQARLARVQAIPALDAGVPEDEQAMGDVMGLLRVRTGHDFSNYKLATVRRRIERRISVRGVQNLTDYARLMRDQPDEAVALMKELLISVTNFFRDANAFATLEQLVIPRLFERKSSDDQLRVWSAGCATGEEAYALAMLLVEAAASLEQPPAIQVFATDLDEHAITTARDGVYTEGDVTDVSPERLQRFFQRDAAGYRVRRELREMVLFAHHNVLRDPPFSHLDLIACRNLLIYLNRAAQERLLDTFQFALRPGGYLFLGPSESPEGHSDAFALFDKPAHVYELRAAASRLPVPSTNQPIPAASVLPRGPESKPVERITPGELHLRLLEQLAPPSVIVTEDHNVVHMSENAARYLKISGGEPTRNLFRLAHAELRTDLRMAVHLATQQRAPAHVRGTRLAGVGPEGADALVRITVKPVLRDGAPPSGYFLVLFEDESAPAPPRDKRMELISPTDADLQDVEDDLARTREQLRLTIEQYESQAVEAKAGNEELQAINEELRSAAEELETSKEELQSVNEELTTVNQELKTKIDELGMTYNDFLNLISSTQIGAVFLDNALRVKLSTPRAQEIFNLLPVDVGRSFSDITTRLDYPDLHDDLAGVLATLQTVEREVPSREGRWYNLRVVPYRTLDDRIEGVAITFQDVTGRRTAEQRERAGEERLRLLIDSAIDYAIFTMTRDGVIDSWNSGAERMFGYTAAEIIGKHCAVLFTPEDRFAGVPIEELRRAGETGRAEDERWHIRKDGSRFYCSGVTTALGEAERFGFAKIARDLTQQRQAEIALEQARADLEDRVRRRTAQLETEVKQHADSRTQVTALLRKVVTAQEDQRARIARDLHDQLGQQLTALRLTLERHREQHGTDGNTDDVERALNLARDIDSAVDFLAWELRPAALDDLGLGTALPRFLQEWTAHNGIPTEFEATGSVAGLLSRDAEVTFYRIAQEALNNVLKHAHATRVDVVLESRDGDVVLIIEDDGVGFDAGDDDTKENGIGLIGMAERATLIGATLQLESAPGKGTTVYLRCPAQASGQQQS